MQTYQRDRRECGTMQKDGITFSTKNVENVAPMVHGSGLHLTDPLDVCGLKNGMTRCILERA